VVAFDSGGLPDIVQHDRTGILVSEVDPAALAAALVSLLERDDHGAALGAAARLHALATFAPESVARRYADIYRFAIAGSTKSALASRTDRLRGDRAHFHRARARRELAGLPHVGVRRAPRVGLPGGGERRRGRHLRAADRRLAAHSGCVGVAALVRAGVAHLVRLESRAVCAGPDLEHPRDEPARARG